MTQRFSLPFVEHICLYFYITLNDVIKKNFQLEALRKLKCGQVLKFLISCLSSWQSISKFIETAKLPTLIYSLDTILLAQIIQILCLHLLMSSSFPLKYFIAILNYKICFSQNFLPCVLHFQFLLLKIEFATTSLYSGLLQKTCNVVISLLSVLVSAVKFFCVLLALSIQSRRGSKRGQICYSVYI